MVLTKRTLRNYPSLRKKIELVAASKKMTFNDAIVFLLRGVYTSNFSAGVFTPNNNKEGK